MPDEALTVEEAQVRVAKAEQREQRCREAWEAADAAFEDARSELGKAKAALRFANRVAIEAAKEES